MKRFWMMVLAVGLALAGPAVWAQKFEGLAETPPMGWNSWNKFACDVNEQLIRETADAMVASGLRDAGYQYINIDDCWQGERDARGFMQADKQRFPSGMKALADYVHAKGLKFGVYSDAGWKTCGGRPGSRGYEFQDALTYAEWGVDYLKYDWCFTEGLKAEGAYQTMSQALRQAGRPILFSLCEWGTSKPWEWAGKVGHAWRTTGDIYNCFDCVKDNGDWKAFGVLQIMDMQEGLRAHAGPGRWNDADMLEVGNGMPVNQERAHFSIWAMLASPLIAGNDLRQMNKETLAVLSRRDVIAVNQDALGVPGWRQSAVDGLEVWFRPLAGGDWAVMALNRSTQPRRLALDWAKLKVNDPVSGRDAALASLRYDLRDLWTGRASGHTGSPLSAEVPGQDVLMLRLTPRR
ncbi:glycoside hydrolase family 27 protein [Ideonella sp.]|uniref:glycoside hydrolase family 27 protein n=1 Tax=Ideonella sp. TaxID=1929293 RepID=UPI003BB79483